MCAVKHAAVGSLLGNSLGGGCITAANGLVIRMDKLFGGFVTQKPKPEAPSGLKAQPSGLKAQLWASSLKQQMNNQKKETTVSSIRQSSSKKGESMTPARKLLLKTLEKIGEEEGALSQQIGQALEEYVDDLVCGAADRVLPKKFEDPHPAKEEEDGEEDMEMEEDMEKKKHWEEFKQILNLEIDNVNKQFESTEKLCANLLERQWDLSKDNNEDGLSPMELLFFTAHQCQGIYCPGADYDLDKMVEWTNRLWNI
jgi:hypothetical protein